MHHRNYVIVVGSGRILSRIWWWLGRNWISRFVRLIGRAAFCGTESRAARGDHTSTIFSNATHSNMYFLLCRYLTVIRLLENLINLLYSSRSLRNRRASDVLFTTYLLFVHTFDLASYVLRIYFFLSVRGSFIYLSVATCFVWNSDTDSY